MKNLTILLIGFLLPYFGISQLYTPGAGVTDIDGNTYQTIVINGQEWMAENLRTSKYVNGDPIPNVTDGALWSNLTTGAWVHYENNSSYENPYGKLYNWYTVADSRNVCPTGWHVPSEVDWSLFINYLDPTAGGGNNIPNNAGGKIKSTGTEYWQAPNIGATNQSGFCGQPSGMRGFTGEYLNLGIAGIWWTESESSLIKAFYKFSLYSNEYVDHHDDYKTYGFSVRCLKNSTSVINEIKPSSKTLIKVFDIMGNETVVIPNELQFYLYNDGSIEKKIVMEK
jgi:uncharacterized protein (TIGR02145 family)